MAKGFNFSYYQTIHTQKQKKQRTFSTDDKICFPFLLLKILTLRCYRFCSTAAKYCSKHAINNIVSIWFIIIMKRTNTNFINLNSITYILFASSHQYVIFQNINCCRCVPYFFKCKINNIYYMCF